MLAGCSRAHRPLTPVAAPGCEGSGGGFGTQGGGAAGGGDVQVPVGPLGGQADHRPPARERRLVNGIAKDPEFLKAVAESENGGKLTSRTESVLLGPTDYSPIR